MPVERLKLGRAYTRRERLVLTCPVSPADRTEFLPREAVSAPGPSYVWRLKPALEWARTVLERTGLPLDPNAAVYADRAWRLANERRSPEWYAIQILMVGRDLRLFAERGNAAIAADLGIDFGELVTEARIAGYFDRNAARGGQVKAAERRAEIEERSDEWRRQAAEYWSRHPRWSAMTVAGRIDPARLRTVWNAIIKQKPVPKRKIG